MYLKTDIYFQAEWNLTVILTMCYLQKSSCVVEPIKYKTYIKFCFCILLFLFWSLHTSVSMFENTLVYVYAWLVRWYTPFLYKSSVRLCISSFVQLGRRWKDFILNMDRDYILVLLCPSITHSCPCKNFSSIGFVVFKHEIIAAYATTKCLS